LKAVEYSEHLKKRGYNQHLIQKSFKDIGNLPRNEARQPVNKEGTVNPIIFATKYNPRGPNVNAIVKRFLPILNENPILKELFPDRSVMVANKKENNLTNLLLRSDPYNIKQDIIDNQECGYAKCDRNCDSCKNFVLETTSVTSNATGRKFHIRRKTSCCSPYLIYIACCQSCGKQGVGSTVSWKPRLANYKSHIKKESEHAE